MTKWKVLAVFFTLLFFSSLRVALFYYFSYRQSVNSGAVGLVLAALASLVMLYLAIRFWRLSFSADKKQRD